MFHPLIILHIYINNKQLAALASSLCSLISNVEHNKMPHSVNCVKCVKKHKDHIGLLADSSTSLHFTNERSDLSEYEVVNDKEFTITTASAGHPLIVKGWGLMFLHTSGIHRGKETRWVIQLYPVFYVKGLTHKYLSASALLNIRLELRGSSSKLEFRTHKSNCLEFLCEPHELVQDLYWLSAMLVHADSLLAMLMVPSIDYNIMLLVVLFPISFCSPSILFYWCPDGITVYHYLLCHVFNPESEYSTPQLLTLDSRYSFSSYSQYT